MDYEAGSLSAGHSPPYAKFQPPDPAATLTAPDACLVTCEHGGNRIPPRYRACFRGHEALLHTHRGYDIGALRVARELAAALGAPLLAATASRLLIDLNRSRGHPRLYSEATRSLPPALRHEILERYYLPYRTHAESRIARAIEGGARVLHVSCHSFTPQLDGSIRNTDFGLLYDPARPLEAGLCRRWGRALDARAAPLRVRMNYPYRGTADGFTTYLRKRFPADRYLGIELEINQKHVLEGAQHWRAVRKAIIGALQATPVLL